MARGLLPCNKPPAQAGVREKVGNKIMFKPIGHTALGQCTLDLSNDTEIREKPKGSCNQLMTYKTI